MWCIKLTGSVHVHLASKSYVFSEATIFILLKPMSFDYSVPEIFFLWWIMKFLDESKLDIQANKRITLNAIPCLFIWMPHVMYQLIQNTRVYRLEPLACTWFLLGKGGTPRNGLELLSIMFVILSSMLIISLISEIVSFDFTEEAVRLSHSWIPFLKRIFAI